MKTAIVYYSYTQNTKKWAEEKAHEIGADLIEIRERKHRSAIGAYVCGSLAARRRKSADIEPLTADLAAYDSLILAVPIWAGFPATPFNNMVSLLPREKTVELVMVSGSGDSKGSAEGTRRLIEDAGCKVTGYSDVKR